MDRVEKLARAMAKHANPETDVDQIVEFGTPWILNTPMAYEVTGKKPFSAPLWTLFVEWAKAMIEADV